jgi:hypothetical protein
MFFLLSFLVCKIGEQEGKTDPCPGSRVGTSKRGEMMGKGGRRVNTVPKNVYTCM